jgi:putative addiction module component (TIGR02574 family)
MKQLPYGLSELTVAERVELAEDLWDSIVDTPDAVPLTDAQKAELDARLSAHDSDPDNVSPWPEVRDRLLRRRGS